MSGRHHELTAEEIARSSDEVFFACIDKNVADALGRWRKAAAAWPELSERAFVLRFVKMLIAEGQHPSMAEWVTAFCRHITKGER